MYEKHNFPIDTTYDHSCHSIERDLRSKNVIPLIAMGVGGGDRYDSKICAYSESDRDTLKKHRDAIPTPTSKTVMQKIISRDDLDRYKRDGHIKGFVTKAADAVPFTETPSDCYQNMRLDYCDTPFRNPNESVYAIRYTDGVAYSIPYSKEFSASSVLEQRQPFTGNGYVGCKEHVIPEYLVDINRAPFGIEPTAGEIYEIFPDGREALVARYDEDEKCFDFDEQGVVA